MWFGLVEEKKDFRGIAAMVSGKCIDEKEIKDILFCVIQCNLPSDTSLKDADKNINYFSVPSWLLFLFIVALCNECP